MRKITIEELVPFVRALNPERRSFNLSPCICGAPSWKQPCPFCGFYPYGNDPIERKRCESKYAQLGAFLRHLNGRGIARFYLENEIARLKGFLQDQYLRQNDIEAITKCLDGYGSDMLALSEVEEPNTIDVWENFRNEKKIKTLNGWNY